MKQVLIALFAVLLGVGLTMDSAEARRVGGGGSSGMQRSQPIKRDAAPTQNQNQNAAPTPGRPAQPATPAAQPSGMGRWLAPLAGIAAGIGLAALLSHFGLSETVAAVVMMLLVIAAVFFVLRWLLRRFQPQSRPLQYAGGPAGGATRYQAPTIGGGAATATAASEPDVGLPADLDVDSFVRHAKLNFVRLQAANDAGDLEDLRKFTTPEMFAEIKLQLQERGDAPQKTDVVTLDAELLGFITEFREHIASVRFTGTIREAADGEPQAFDEIWHITKPVDDSRNWAIAGIQQTQ